MSLAVVRRPLFTVLAGVGVLGAAGLATVAQPVEAGAALAEEAVLSPDEKVIADAQTLADAQDAAAIDVLVERGAAIDEANQRKAEAEAAAREAARVAAEQEKRERAAREAARERATRDAQRDPRPLAKIMVSERGWSSEQFSCLDSLWTKESNWRWYADNPTSSAYGIPQALPGSRMAANGADWETNPVTQIAWGLDYIDDRYGTPCSAWAHSQARNWY